VWIGYDDNRPLEHETGGAVAVPVYVEIMKHLSPPAKPFPRPAHSAGST
jgi:membrane carboxypeptidase/penicillin-binding protein